MSGQNPTNNTTNPPPQYATDNQSPYSNPWSSESQGQNPPPHTFNPPSQTYDHTPTPFAQEPSYNPPSHAPPSHHQHQHHQHHRDASPPAPVLPPRRTGTTSEPALPQGPDRTHQVEVMQSYEASRPPTEDEQNQAVLEREFPGIDGSLIAAIYGDSGSLSATREMLQELSSTEGGAS